MKYPYWYCLKDIIRETFKEKHIKISFSTSVFLLIVGMGSNISIPLIFKEIIETLSTNESSQVILGLIGYGCIWLISQISTNLRTLFVYTIEQRITYTLGVKVISHLYGLSHGYFIEKKPGAIVNLIRRAQQDVPTIILGFLFQVLPTLVEFLCVIVLIATLYPPHLSLLLGSTLILYFFYTYFTMKFVLQERHRANEVDQNVDGVVTDWLSNYETIKTFGQKSLAVNKCQQELKNREQAEVKFIKNFSLARLGQSFILSLGLYLVTYLVGVSVMIGDLTVGDFVLFNGYILQFIIPLNILGQITQDIKKAFINMQGVVDVLLTESDIKPGQKQFLDSEKNLHVEFENVDFNYQGIKILNNISFKIEAGETVLIIGPSGIGKSTIAKLMLRLYDVNQGQILINKINIKDLTFESLYNTICWVPQETYLLNDTIKNNLQFVKPEASIHDIEVALKQAALFDFVQSLPNGLDTFVGDKGMKLSGGQKQRISLARLFLKKPKICIFDEPTSFLDHNTENIIQTHINTDLSLMTKIIITHRPFMVNKADKIIKISKNGDFEMTSFNTNRSKKENFPFLSRNKMKEG